MEEYLTYQKWPFLLACDGYYLFVTSDGYNLVKELINIMGDFIQLQLAH